MATLRHHLSQTIGRMFPDKIFLNLMFHSRMGYWINWKRPQTFNEKLQWLKVYYRRPEFTTMVDKYAVKHYISEKIGKKYVLPLIGVWEKPKDIDFDLLPNQFVLKTTHDSGSVVVCPDKTKLDKKAVCKKLIKSLKKNYYYEQREYPYKNVKPRIIAEQYMVDESGTELKDYKFFCFDGKCKMLFVATERQTREEPFFNFFDRDFNPLPFKQGHPVNPVVPKKPENFEEMIRIAEHLSIGFPHIRVDLYNINGKIYFGEFTFFHFSGNVPFEPAEWDHKIGEWLNLPEKQNC